MKTVNVDFNKMTMVVVGINKVVIGDNELKFINSCKSVAMENKSVVSIENAVSVGLSVGDVHDVTITKTYKDLDKNSTVIVDEKFSGIVSVIKTGVANMDDVGMGTYIEIQIISDIECTTEVKEKIDEMEDSIRKLQREMVELKIELEKEKKSNQEIIFDLAFAHRRIKDIFKD